ncbi:MAG: serine hydrolase [Patescibacteria group bacterium]|jgi:D-alanyl-D-alanine endopeptidase (penicillin-binding protein 7)
MILKALGSFIMAAGLWQLLPTDLSALEYRAGVGGEEASKISYVEFENEQASLPRAGMRSMVNYPVKTDPGSFGVVTTARSVLIEDADSGMIMVAKHPYAIRSIGSVTKLMTALVFLETNPDLNASVTLTDADLIEGGRIYLRFEDPIVLHDLLQAGLIGSDNSAMESLVRLSGLSNEAFVIRMNSKAKELGMSNSVFVDPSGIDAGNTSTAYDLVALLRAAEQEPEIVEAMQTAKITVRQASGYSVDIENTNELLTSFVNEDPFSVRAGKTGYLPQAGYVLATAVAKNDHKIYVVVMGSDSKDTRVLESKGLISWAFKTFSWPTN